MTGAACYRTANGSRAGEGNVVTTATSKAPSKKALREAEEAEALAALREELQGVETIYTVLTYLSRDGMTRAIKPLIATPYGQIHDLSWRLARAGLGRVNQKHGGIIMGGCGMDMGFALVYEIGRAVIGNEPWQCRGYDTTGATRVRCGSNEHVNTPRVEFGTDVMHTGDGGYRFRHEWI